MSAYTTRPPAQILTITPPTVPVTEAVHAELDAFLSASHQVETVLHQGRANCVRLKDELTSLQRRQEDSLRASEKKLQEFNATVSTLQKRENELKTRNEALERSLSHGKENFEALRATARQKFEAFAGREEKFKAALLADRARLEADRAAHQATEERLSLQLAEVSEALNRATAELNLYKNSWTTVMQLDREAALHLKDRPELLARVEQLEALNVTLSAEARERIRAVEAEAQSLRTQQAQSEQDLTKSLRELKRIQTESELVIQQLQDKLLQTAEATELLARIEKLEIQNRALATQLRDRDQLAETEIHDLKQRQEQTERELTQSRYEQERFKAESEAGIRRYRENLAEAESSAHFYKERATSLASVLNSQQDELLQKDLQTIAADRHSMAKELENAILTMSHAKAQGAQAQARAKKEEQPLRALLDHKELELSRATHEIRKLSPGHPTRPQAEQILAALQEQRDQLRKVLKESETQ